MRTLKGWPKVASAKARQSTFYDTVLDGKVKVLERSKDFTGTAQQMRVRLYSAARQRQLKLRTHKMSEEELMVQAVKA